MPFCIPAQELRFEQYTTKQGLLSDEVFNLHQDKKGYLWVFSNYGTVKYNSVEFRQVLKNLPIRESFIYCSFENKQGRMWVANSNARIFEIRNDSAVIVPGTGAFSETLRKNVEEIYQLYIDDSINIYTLTKHASYKLVKARNYEPVNISSSIKDSIETKVLDKGNVQLPVLKYTGNDSTYCGGFTKFRIGLENPAKVFDLQCRPTNVKYVKKFGDDIFISHHDHIIRALKNGFKPVYVGGLIHNFTRDKNNHLWVATYNKGLFELDENDSVINHYFRNTTINDLAIDFQNGLWVSTTGFGLYHCNDLNSFIYTDPSPLGQPINVIKKTGDELIVANALGDLVSITPHETRVIKIHEKEFEPLDLIKTDNKYLIGYRYRIEQFDPLARVNKSSVYNPSATVLQFVPLHEDTMLNVCRKSLILTVKSKIERVIGLNFKAYCAKRINGTLFLGMENGVWQFSGDGLLQGDAFSVTKNSIISAITTDPDGNAWFSSPGSGLFRLNSGGELKNYTVREGLPSDIVNNISFSENGEILLTCNKGIYYAWYNQQHQFKWQLIYPGAIQHAVIFHNKIYAATKKGLAVLDFKKSANQIESRFLLRGIRVNSQENDSSKLKSLEHNQNNLDFIFDIISYNDDKFSLEYRLDGPVRDSGTSQFNVLTFQNLLPGNYFLSVRPQPGNINKAISIAFYISPAFWQTNWFRILLLSIALSVTILIAYFFFRYRKRKEHKRTQAERMILEYRLIALKAQINPHFMSNCLTAVQHLIIKNKLEEATAYIAKFGLLVRQILNFSTRSMITLKEELAIARLNMELEQLRFENKFTFTIQVQEDIDVKEIYVPALMLNPIIENAIWHGLIPVKEIRKGNILIDINTTGAMLKLIIEDNGAGRSNDSSHPGNIQESKGIKLTEQRLTNINYLYNMESSGMIYEDLQDANGKPAGTRVIITIPSNLTPIKNE